MPPQDHETDESQPQLTSPSQSKGTWAAIIEAVKTPLGFYALSTLVVEAGLGSLALAIPAYQLYLIISFVFFLFLLIVLVTVAAFFYPKVFDQRIEDRTYQQIPEIFCQVLDNRRGLYIKATELITSAKTIVDTTWGPDPREPSPSESNAREKYINAQRTAIKKGIDYCELVSDSPARLERYQSSLELKNRFSNYQIRTLKIFTEQFYMIDFLVADSEHILFSHVNSLEPGTKNKYIYCRCKPVAELFVGLFRQCWNDASTFSTTSSADNS